MTQEAGAALLTWFDAHARALPWRGSDDPYAVLVSEIMSQQTRIETVRDYWTRWMAEFPTIEALAAAEVADVMRMWAGLGYYRRARNLHACAREVVAGAAGKLPPTAAELAELPGIGPYTSAAIASIVFGEAVPAVDGNVSRVIARMEAIDEEPTRASFRRRVAAGAAKLLDAQRPGTSNEALMELGATVCTPRAPRCDQCPIAASCEARATGEPTAFPRPKPRKAPRRETRRCVVALHDRGVFVRTGTERLLGGLLEFPTYEAETTPAAVAELEREHGLSGEPEELGAVEHVFSHIRMTYEVVRIRVELDGSRARGGVWMAPEALADAALSVAMRRVASLVPELVE